ncbi:MAG: TRAP transporter small permease [Rhodospirillales bacterium]|nr:TRAP transporter small permease [Rhodospirillales bacterium]
MKPIQSALNSATDGTIGIAAVFMMAMMVHIVADVLSKWLFNFPLDGTLEIVSNYYMVGLIFFPLAYVQRKGAHIVAEIFTKNLAERVRHGLDSVIGLFMTAYTVIFVWHMSIEAMRKTVELEYLEATELFIVIWPVRWVLPIGFALMGVTALYQSLRSINKLFSNPRSETGG